MTAPVISPPGRPADTRSGRHGDDVDGQAPVDPPVAPRPRSGVGHGRSLAYQPALDGLRGLALLAIFAYHAGFDWAPGAFLSVSTFFTLSGFLITTVLLREFGRDGRVDRTRFWSRRLRRLLPASLLATFFIVITSIRFGESSQLARLPGDVLASVTNLANWRFVAQGDSYGALFATKSPMQHFWSLAIEEQFYLLYPLVLAAALVASRGSRRVATVVVGGLALASLAGSLWLLAGGASIDRLYFGTDVRAAELLIGGLLALWWPQKRAVMQHSRARPVTIIGGAAVFAVVLVLWRFADHEDAVWYQGGLVLYAVATCFIILAALQPIGPVRSVLTWRPLVWLGLISYGAYLFHWPVFLWVDDRTGLAEWPLFALRIAVTILLATASYFLLEAPVRRGAIAKRTALVLAPSIACVALVAAMVVASLQPEPIDLDNARGVTAKPGQNTKFPDTPTVGVYGDSTAYTLGLGFGDWTKAHPDLLWSNGGWAGMGCGSLELTRRYRDKLVTYPGECRGWVATWEKAARESQNDVALVLIGPWEVAEIQLPGEKQFRVVGDKAIDDAIRTKLSEAVGVLRASGARVVLLTAPDIDTGRVNGRSPRNKPPETDPKRMGRFNEILREVAESRDGVLVVDLAAGIKARGAEDMQLRPDGIHYSWEGGHAVSEWLGPEILKALQEQPSRANQR